MHLRREDAWWHAQKNFRADQEIAERKLPRAKQTKWTTGIMHDTNEQVYVQIGNENLLLYGGKVATCAQCGHRYVHENKKNNKRAEKYCSPECWHASRHKYTTVSCMYCGKIYKIDAQETDYAQFCSDECEWLFINTLKDINGNNPQERPLVCTCVNCGKMYLSIRRNNVRFCSNLCEREFTQKSRLQEYTCAECGKQFTSYQANPKFCSIGCGSKYMLREHPEYIASMRTGGKSWTKGKNAKDNPLIAAMADRRAVTMRDGIASGRIKLYFTGKQLTAEHKRHCAEGQARAIREGRRKASVHVISGKFSDIGHYVRSGWEYNFAKILHYLGRRYEYEKRTFMLSRGQTYTPDFYLPDRDIYYEIKGWFPQEQQDKVALFQAEYPDIVLHVVTPDKYKRIYRAFIHKVRLIRCFNDSRHMAHFLTPVEIDALRGR